MARSNLAKCSRPPLVVRRRSYRLGLRTISSHEGLLLLHRQGEVHVGAVVEEVEVGPVEPVERLHQGHRRLAEVACCQLGGVATAVVGHLGVRKVGRKMACWSGFEGQERKEVQPTKGAKSSPARRPMC